MFWLSANNFVNNVQPGRPLYKEIIYKSKTDKKFIVKDKKSKKKTAWRKCHSTLFDINIYNNNQRFLVCFQFKDLFCLFFLLFFFLQSVINSSFIISYVGMLLSIFVFRWIRRVYRTVKTKRRRTKKKWKIWEKCWAKK